MLSLEATEAKMIEATFEGPKFNKVRLDVEGGPDKFTVTAEITFENMDAMDLYEFLRLLKHPPLIMELKSRQSEMPLGEPS